MFKFLYQTSPSLSPQTATLLPDTLGALCFARQAAAGIPDVADQSTHQHVAMRTLGEYAALHASLHLSESGPMQSGQHDAVRYRCNDSILFGVITLDETDFSASDTGSPLQAASRAAYERIFSMLGKKGFPYPLRFWNYMADINGVSHQLERYLQFNLGRQQAFAARGKDAANNLPAACALGMAGGPLTVAFLAGRAPSLPIENPRQISAYDYPPQYGPRSPLFSRASVASVANTRMLFLSGTASIVGHATLHAGDVTAQTEESLRNIAAVLAAAGSRTGAACEPADLDYIVYIRHAADFATVRDVLERHLGADLKAWYVEADICRADLLVEIEGAAQLPPH